MEIINQSFENPIQIEKGQNLGFLVVERDNLNFKQLPTKKKTPTKKNKKIYTAKRKKAGLRLFEQV